MGLILIAVVFVPGLVYPALSPADLRGVASASTHIDLQNARFTRTH
jgi:hypothetical protein